jgi:hypothetical protein
MPEQESGVAGVQELQNRDHLGSKLLVRDLALVVVLGLPRSDRSNSPFSSDADILKKDR